MKLATLKSASADGSLIVVSRDLKQAVSAGDIARNMLDAITRWEAVLPDLQSLSDQLNSGACRNAFVFDERACMAPLPRTWQWLDGSAFLNHGHLMEQAFNTPPLPDFDTIPVLYQGAGDDFLGPYEDVLLPDENHGIDFEGEFAVVVDKVPLGVTADEALRHVRLITQLNDWSLRNFGPREMKCGFGFVQAKPSTSFAPVAVTPDELGAAWRLGRVNLRLHIEWNGNWFGWPRGDEMNFHFGELIAHAARTRRLSAGTIVGSGTLSNNDRQAGSACIAEKRVLEIIDNGSPSTNFMRFGDRVRMEARFPNADASIFGAIDQRVIQVQAD